MLRFLISGANRGIGLALSRALVERGCFVFVGARRPGEADELQTLAHEQPQFCSVVELDVTDPASVAACVERVKSGGEALDVLINNAAVFLEEGREALAELEVELFDHTFAVNVTGVARLTQACLTLLLRSQSPAIVNISSGAGSISDKNSHSYYCYGASKAALNHFTVGLAHELRSKNVVVTAISPGWVRTKMGGEDAELSAEESAGAIADTILKLTSKDSGCFLNRFGRHGQYQW